jgi:hypothetical protein
VTAAAARAHNGPARARRALGAAHRSPHLMREAIRCHQRQSAAISGSQVGVPARRSPHLARCPGGATARRRARGSASRRPGYERKGGMGTVRGVRADQTP